MGSEQCLGMNCFRSSSRTVRNGNGCLLLRLPARLTEPRSRRARMASPLPVLWLDLGRVKPVNRTPH
jgi:hypothetical protein